MQTIEHTTEINAPAATTGAVFEDFAAYESWNPFNHHINPHTM